MSAVFRFWIFGMLAGYVAAAAGYGQALDVDALDAVPFAEPAVEAASQERRESFFTAASAKRALGAGLYELAYELGVEALETAADAVEDWGTQLVVLDSLLARSEWIEARARLDAMLATEAAPVGRLALREAMIEFAEGDAVSVGERLAGLEDVEWTPGERAWFSFLSGWQAVTVGDVERGRLLMDAARETAGEVSPALRSQIGYLVFRSLLATRNAGADTIPQLQNALLETVGEEVWFAFAQQLAVLLYDSGQEREAIDLIQRGMRAAPDGLALERAQFQLLATMAAGVDSVVGRKALGDLLAANRFPELMSIALQQAFSDARLGDASGMDVVAANLDLVIEREQEHELLDQALYYRAVLKFLEDDFRGAEEDAARLQEQFPVSPYRRGLLALQASSAWNRERYRTAASRLQQMREEFGDLATDYRLSALIADCYLRAGLRSGTREDFRNAAEAYAAALGSVVSSNEGGPLFFQLVLSRLKAGQFDLARESVDNPELLRFASSDMVWRAEWLVLQEMRRLGRLDDAYARAKTAVEAVDIDVMLRLRMLWLCARLSVAAGDPEATEAWVSRIENLATSESIADADPVLVARVMSSSLVVLSDSLFARDRPEEAVEVLERVRRDYEGYGPALMSYISQARYLSRVNRAVEAQQLLTSLADRYSEHPLAPVALFEAALNAEQRGQDEYLDEATRLLDRIATDYADSEIVYRARLMQADLLRRLNKFGSAEQIYEYLEDRYADRPDRFLAQMSLADTLLAQADQNASKFDQAVSRLEFLMDLPRNSVDAPLDLRVEAGYKLGKAWRSRGELLKAKQIFWQVYDETVSGGQQVGALSRKGRYWLARCLFDLGEIFTETGALDQANGFYEAVVRHGLPGGELARARMQVLAEPTRNN